MHIRDIRYPSLTLLGCAVGRCALEAIMVLRIQDGNDIFLAAGGSYAPSFFGLSLATLAGLPRCAADSELLHETR